MTSEVIYEKFVPPNSRRKGLAALKADWAGSDGTKAEYMKAHSIKGVAKEILNIAKSTGAVQVNIAAMPGQGKTTLAQTLAHLMHQKAWEEDNTPFAVKQWTRSQLLNVRKEIEQLDPINHILIFDDVSWLQSGKVPKEKIDDIIHAMTEIRHLKGGDYQIISILDFHYSYALPKPLRNAQYWFYLSIGSSELENVMKLVHAKNMRKVMEFRKVHSQAQNWKKFQYRVGREWMEYHYRKPFAPAIFWNGDSLRHVVFPAREWIDRSCSICGSFSDLDAMDQSMLERLKVDANTAYGESIVKQALRIMLLQMGLDCYSPSVNQCIRWLAEYFKENHLAPKKEELAATFGLESRRTAQRKQVPKIESQ